MQTRNQRQIVDLARRIVDGVVDEDCLSDEQWATLMLAAQLLGVRASAVLAARRVLMFAESRLGYFERAATAATATA